LSEANCGLAGIAQQSWHRSTSAFAQSTSLGAEHECDVALVQRGQVLSGLRRHACAGRAAEDRTRGRTRSLRSPTQRLRGRSPCLARCGSPRAHRPLGRERDSIGVAAIAGISRINHDETANPMVLMARAAAPMLAARVGCTSTKRMRSKGKGAGTVGG